MKTSLKNRAVMLVAAVTMAVASLAFVPVQSASAAAPNGGVYGIVSPRDGWCAHPLIAWWNSTTGQSGTDYSGTDDIFWLPVRLGTSNSVTLTVYCGNGRGWYGSIKPTRNKQSVFFRYPNGATVK